MKTKQIHEASEFNRLNHAIDKVYRDIALKSNLSDSAFIVFYTISEIGDGCSQKDICNTSSLSKQTIHSSIRCLEKAGYVRLASGKGRDKHIFLTAAGEQLIHEKIIPIVNAENSVFNEMTAEERSELLRITEKYLILFQEKTNASEPT